MCQTLVHGGSLAGVHHQAALYQVLQLRYFPHLGERLLFEKKITILKKNYYYIKNKIYNILKNNYYYNKKYIIIIIFNII